MTFQFVSAWTNYFTPPPVPSPITAPASLELVRTSSLSKLPRSLHLPNSVSGHPPGRPGISLFVSLDSLSPCPREREKKAVKKQWLRKSILNWEIRSTWWSGSRKTKVHFSRQFVTSWCEYQSQSKITSSYFPRLIFISPKCFSCRECFCFISVGRIITLKSSSVSQKYNKLALRLGSTLRTWKNLFSKYACIYYPFNKLLSYGTYSE